MLKKKDQKLVITDRRDMVWKDRCVHTYSDNKECKRLLDEDTGSCPKGHGSLRHVCKTKCCSELVGGNHKFCKYHRAKKLLSICNIQKRIQKEYGRRMGWYDKFRGISIDSYQGKIDFAIWKNKQLGFTDKIEELKLLLKEEVA